MTFISEASADLLPKAEHVLGNWRLNVWQLASDKFPIVTVRIGPSNIIETAYGRELGGGVSGQYVMYAWSAFVFEANSDEPNLKAKDAMILADIIMTYLAKKCDKASGIIHIYDMVVRESEPARGSQRMSRIVVEGRLLARRPL